jgi:hypothetical protein
MSRVFERQTAAQRCVRVERFQRLPHRRDARPTRNGEMSATVPRGLYYALASNVAVALCKFATAVYTAAGAALTEAIHLCADCMSQFLCWSAAARQADTPANSIRSALAGNRTFIQ